MKTLLLISLILAGCGGRGSMPPIGERADGVSSDEGVIVYKYACRHTYLDTEFKYIAFVFPNGDTETWCEINWLGEAEYRVGRGHRYTRTGSCFLKPAAQEDPYWRFYVDSQGSARGEWSALEQPTKSGEYNLPYSFQFSCTMTETEDEYWFERYWDFEEYLL